MLFYKKAYQQVVAERDYWQEACNKNSIKIKKMHSTIQKLKGMCDWLEKENEKLRKKDPFTFDKAEFQRLKLENAELKKEVEELHAKNKGAKK